MKHQRLLPIINFRDGIKAVPGFFGGRIRDILNLDLDDNGFCVPRPATEPVAVSRNDAGQLVIDDTQITIGTDAENAPIHYETGDQLVIAHWLGDTEGDPVTRVYFLDAEDSWVSSHRGRILYIAGTAGKYFIDLKNNKRYDWEFEALRITQVENNDGIDELITRYNTLVLTLLTYFRSDRTFQTQYPDFPGEGQTVGLAAGVPYAFKTAYSSDEIGFESPASEPFVAQVPHLYLETSDTYQWLLTHRPSLLADTWINNTEFDLIDDIREQSPVAVYVDKTNFPRWTNLGLEVDVYAARIPDEIYDIVEGELTITDEIALQALPDSEYARISRSVPNILLYQRIPISVAPEEELIHYLDAEFNYPPPENIYAITEHAGRIYAVNRDNQNIIFTHINGEGVSNRWVFPPHNSISTDASGITPIQALEQMPNHGGLYVFKRDAIHYIEGQNIFSGLYSINVDVSTDISAADYKKNIGCISPRSIENDGEKVLFVGSDTQVYALSGKTSQRIGASITPFIKALTIEQQQKIVTEWHNERFYLTLPDSVLILNTERKYWTRFDWTLTDMFWSRGGQYAESKLYGLTPEDELILLGIDNGDTDFPIVWESNVHVLPTTSFLTGVRVYSNDGEPVTVTVSGNEPVKEITRTFTPRLSNRYRAGVHTRGRNMEIKVESDQGIMIDRIEIEETY